MLDIEGLWDFSDAAGSEANFRKALAEAPAERHAERLELRTQVARALGLQGRFEEGHAELDAVRAELRDDETRAHMRLLLERGRLLSSAKRIEQARAPFLEAWELGQRKRLDRLAVDAAHMLAIVERAAPELALEWNLKALAYAEQSDQPDAKKWLGPLYNNIGWTHFDNAEYEQALEFLERGLAFRQERDDLEATLIARWSVGRVLRALGRIDEALELQQELAGAYVDAKLEPSGYVHEELGECLLALGEGGHQAHFQKAYDLLSQERWLVESEGDRIERLKRLAEADE